MRRRETTLAEDWERLRRSLHALGLAILHSLGLHTRAELDAKTRLAASFAREAAHAFAQKREAERLLVLLSEPLKDWDLADFPSAGPEAHHHLRAIEEAYRLTASAVAPLRMGRVVDDKARRRGWDDQPLHPAVAQRLARDPKRLP